MTRVVMLPAIKMDKKTTIQIQGLSYNHLRIRNPLLFNAGGGQGPRKRTLMFWTVPLIESVTVK